MMLKDRSTGKSIRAKPATMKARVYGTVAKRDGLGYFWRNSTPRFHLTTG